MLFQSYSIISIKQCSCVELPKLYAVLASSVSSKQESSRAVPGKSVLYTMLSQNSVAV